jgi:nitronate monooxygenase
VLLDQWGLARSPEALDAALVRRPRALMLVFGDSRPFVSCGIADGRGFAAAIALGADGVLVGSRLRASREAAVSDAMHGATGDPDGANTFVGEAVGLIAAIEPDPAW